MNTITQEFTLELSPFLVKNIDSILNFNRNSSNNQYISIGFDSEGGDEIKKFYLNTNYFTYFNDINHDIYIHSSKNNISPYLSKFLSSRVIQISFKKFRAFWKLMKSINRISYSLNFKVDTKEKGDFISLMFKVDSPYFEEIITVGAIEYSKSEYPDIKKFILRIDKGILLLCRKFVRGYIRLDDFKGTTNLTTRFGVTLRKDYYYNDQRILFNKEEYLECQYDNIVYACNKQKKNFFEFDVDFRIINYLNKIQTNIKQFISIFFSVESIDSSIIKVYYFLENVEGNYSYLLKSVSKVWELGKVDGYMMSENEELYSNIKSNYMENKVKAHNLSYPKKVEIDIITNEEPKFNFYDDDESD